MDLSNTGLQNITGIVSASQYSDTTNLTPTFATSMSFNYSNGQCYYITPTGPVTGITITNIPTTPQKSYVFTFLMNTTNQSKLITATNITTNSTVVPIYYNTNSTPSNNMFVQTLYLVNISSSSTPSFKCLSSYSNY